MKKQSNSIEFKTEHGEKYDIPEEGSLGLLALGYVGLMAWREKRNSVRSTQSSVGSQNVGKINQPIHSS